MKPDILLAQLRALLERVPDFENYTPTSKEHVMWLGQGFALVSRWNQLEAIRFQTSSDMLPVEFMRNNNVGTIFDVLHRAIADLELQVPNKKQVTFAAGEVYDFFKELNGVIESAEKSIFIVDPYLDNTVFDHYLNSKKGDVKVRLLLNKNASNITTASKKYIQQYGDVLEVRKSSKIHDRIIFIDGYVCWVIGQSLKDAAKAKPTYLVPLSPDVVPEKLANYDSIWDQANKI